MRHRPSGVARAKSGTGIRLMEPVPQSAGHPSPRDKPNRNRRRRAACGFSRARSALGCQETAHPRGRDAPSNGRRRRRRAKRRTRRSRTCGGTECDRRRSQKLLRHRWKPERAETKIPRATARRAKRGLRQKRLRLSMHDTSICQLSSWPDMRFVPKNKAFYTV